MPNNLTLEQLPDEISNLLNSTTASSFIYNLIALKRSNSPYEKTLAEVVNQLLVESGAIKYEYKASEFIYTDSYLVDENELSQEIFTNSGLVHVVEPILGEKGGSLTQDLHTLDKIKNFRLNPHVFLDYVNYILAEENGDLTVQLLLHDKSQFTQTITSDENPKMSFTLKITQVGYNGILNWVGGYSLDDKEFDRKFDVHFIGYFKSPLAAITALKTLFYLHREDIINKMEIG